MNGSEEAITNIIEGNRQTKVKMALFCVMEKTELKTGKVILCASTQSSFSSKPEINLPSNKNLCGRDGRTICGPLCHCNSLGGAT